MATVIDSLLVKLGLDSSEFEANRKKVDKGLKDTSKAADSAAQSVAKFLAVVGGVAAIKSFVQNTIEANAALDRFSKNLQQSVTDISAWSQAAEQAGGTAEGLQGTLDMLSKSQTELQLTGNAGVLPYMSALGVAMFDVQGKARSGTDQLLDLADAFSRMDRTTANNMGRAMGIDQGTMNLLLKGRQELETTIKRQKEHDAVTKRQAEEASRLQRTLIEGRQTMAAFGREILSNVTPALEWLLSVFKDVGAWMRENKEFVETFLAVLAAGLAAIGLAVTPINMTALAIAGLAAGIALLWQDYQTWKRGGDSLVDWAKWKVGIDAAKIGIAALRDFTRDAFYRIFAAVDAAKSAFNGDWAHAKWALGEVVSGAPSESPNAPSESPNAPSESPNAPSTPAKRGGTRAERNNNPGNLNFAGQAGATKEGGPGGRFAKFGTMKEGVAALVRQIGLYVKRGKNTIRKIIETYAPAFENNTSAYIAAVSRSIGIGADDPLDMNNAAQVKALVRAIAKHESGKDYLTDEDISAGMQLARGVPGASRAAAAAGAKPMRLASNSNSVETHIGEIKVYTQATDAAGIARDIGGSMDYLFTSPANYGLN